MNWWRRLFPRDAVRDEQVAVVDRAARWYASEGDEGIEDDEVPT